MIPFLYYRYKDALSTIVDREKELLFTIKRKELIIDDNSKLIK
jgi:hypothetical protein